ncbi:MAG: DUF559 domain-containing protein [Cellulomonadaceae bacterium]|nr:DUF559 domain-containing protein [Cellulomonadaceae bacterium]
MNTAGGNSNLRPFSAAEARAAGWTSHRLRSANYRRIFHGIYAPAKLPDSPELRARSALLLAPLGSHVSHSTAARVWGIPVPACSTEHITVRRKKDRRRTGGITFHVLPQARSVTQRNVRLSTPEQTFVDMACTLELVDLVVAGDGIVSAGLASLDRLRDYAAQWSGHGAMKARQGAELVRAQVESPMETRMRLLLAFAGFPELRVNATVVGSDGRNRRLDLSADSVKLAIEYDGRHHIDREPQWEADLRRREQLEQDGWRVIIVTAKDLYRSPGELLDRIHAAALSLGLPGTPRDLRPQWRSHFAGR